MPKTERNSSEKAVYGAIAKQRMEEITHTRSASTKLFHPNSIISKTQKSLNDRGVYTHTYTYTRDRYRIS